MAMFEGKATLVTGAGSGIGRAIAQAFAAEGSRVMIADVDAKGGEETVKLIEAAGGTAAFQKADVSDQASVEAMVKAVVDRFGRLDHAINNAAVDPETGPVPDWDIAVLDRIFAINLRGPYLVLNAALPELLRAEGDRSIVNVASTLAVKLVPGIAPYAAAKGAVISLTKAVAVEYGGDGIRCNAVLPAVVDTPLARADRPDFEARQDAMAEAYPLGRLGEPDEVGEAIRWLCSPGAAWISGATLNVDGGFTS